MALDYFLEITKYGTQEKKAKLRSLILSEFMLVDHEDTGIMTAPGIGVSFFVDEDDFEQNDVANSKTPPNLVIGFRIDKFELQKKGYNLLWQIVHKVIDTVEADLYLTDEDGGVIFLQRELDKTSKMHLDHDIWQSKSD